MTMTRPRLTYGYARLEGRQDYLRSLPSPPQPLASPTIGPNNPTPVDP